jgi:hypothetical protein
MRLTERWTCIRGSRGEAITATILQQSFQKPDWTRWRQQARDVEEVRCMKELRRCENVPESAGRCRSSRGISFTHDQTGD